MEPNPSHPQLLGEESYYMAFVPMFLLTALLGLIGAALAIFLIFGPNLHPVGLAIGGGAGLITALLLCGVAVVIYPVRLSPAALKSYNFWGLPRSVAWQDVESVWHLPLFWLPFLVVRKRGGGNIYVPVFLNEFAAFRDRVRTLAGDDHALTKALFRS